MPENTGIYVIAGLAVGALATYAIYNYVNSQPKEEQPQQQVYFLPQPVNGDGTLIATVTLNGAPVGGANISIKDNRSGDTIDTKVSAADGKVVFLIPATYLSTIINVNGTYTDGGTNYTVNQNVNMPRGQTIRIGVPLVPVVL